jgi:DNA (cytosine-5)-methyltransferase 1
MSLLVDNFAGGGGASLGIRQALGRDVDIAVNHDENAIVMHAANHPRTEHLCESVWDVEPVKVCRGRPVLAAWFSPDCKHFSRAKGARPVNKNIRGLAWVAVRWAKTVRPRVIFLENVREFVDWGPLGPDNQPIPDRRGETFRRFAGSFLRLGYTLEWRILDAADFGAPTHRKRLFLVARCDGNTIQWPQPTHGESGGLFSVRPYRTAAECIDWHQPCPSIFSRKRPLAEKTMQRIALGLRRFVVENPQPFILTIAHGGDESRCRKADRPLPTQTQHNQHALVVAWLEKFYGTARGAAADSPLPTITAGAAGGHIAEVRAFLMKYYGCGCGQGLHEPAHTITTKDRFGLVIVRGLPYRIVDIGLRMLSPRELARCQGFPDDYILTGNKTQQVARIGNSVCPPVAEVLVRANCASVDEVRSVA